MCIRDMIYLEISRFGFFEGRDGKEDWNKYDFYKYADVVEMRIYDLPQKFRTLDIKT